MNRKQRKVNFKRITADLKSVFFLLDCHTKIKEASLPDYLPIVV